MTEGPAIAIRRLPYDVARDLEAKRYHYRKLLDLAAEFAARDLRPFYWNPDTQSITYTRELNIPDNLRTMLRDEATAIVALEQQLYAHNDPSRYDALRNYMHQVAADTLTDVHRDK